jgi:hypothetical protein
MPCRLGMGEVGEDDRSTQEMTSNPRFSNPFLFFSDSFQRSVEDAVKDLHESHFSLTLV